MLGDRRVRHKGRTFSRLSLPENRARSVETPTGCKEQAGDCCHGDKNTCGEQGWEASPTLPFAPQAAAATVGPCVTRLRPGTLQGDGDTLPQHITELGPNNYLAVWCDSCHHLPPPHPQGGVDNLGRS